MERISDFQGIIELGEKVFKPGEDWAGGVGFVAQAIEDYIKNAAKCPYKLEPRRLIRSVESARSSVDELGPSCNQS